MHLNDLGTWGVLWLNKNGLRDGSMSAMAFFRTKAQAAAFVTATGGELWMRHADGTLKREG